MGLGATSPEGATGFSKGDDDLLVLTGIHGLRTNGGDTGHDSGVSRRTHHHGRVGHGTLHHGSTTHSGARTRVSPGRTSSHQASPTRPSASRQAGGHTTHGSLHRSHGHHGHHGHGMRRLPSRGATAARGATGAGTMVATGTSVNGPNSSPPQASSNGGSGAKADTGAGSAASGSAASRRRRHGSARPSRSKPGDAKRHLAPIPRISSAHFTRPTAAAVVDGQPSPTRLERMARLMEPSGVIAGSNRPPSRQKNAFPTHLSEFDKAKPKVREGHSHRARTPEPAVCLPPTHSHHSTHRVRLLAPRTPSHTRTHGKAPLGRCAAGTAAGTPTVAHAPALTLSAVAPVPPPHTHRSVRCLHGVRMTRHGHRHGTSRRRRRCSWRRRAGRATQTTLCSRRRGRRLRTTQSTSQPSPVSSAPCSRSRSWHRAAAPGALRWAQRVRARPGLPWSRCVSCGPTGT